MQKNKMSNTPLYKASKKGKIKRRREVVEKKRRVDSNQFFRRGVPRKFRARRAGLPAICLYASDFSYALNQLGNALRPKKHHLRLCAEFGENAQESVKPRNDIYKWQG
jgi:hypothetical protein